MQQICLGVVHSNIAIIRPAVYIKKTYNNRRPMMLVISRKENDCPCKQYKVLLLLYRYATINCSLTDIQHAFGIIVIVIIIIIGYIQYEGDNNVPYRGFRLFVY